jgi:hypothetical protein
MAADESMARSTCGRKSPSRPAEPASTNNPSHTSSRRRRQRQRRRWRPAVCDVEQYKRGHPASSSLTCAPILGDGPELSEHLPRRAEPADGRVTGEKQMPAASEFHSRLEHCPHLICWRLASAVRKCVGTIFHQVAALDRAVPAAPSAAFYYVGKLAAPLNCHERATPCAGAQRDQPW